MLGLNIFRLLNRLELFALGQFGKANIGQVICLPWLFKPICHITPVR